MRKTEAALRIIAGVEKNVLTYWSDFVPEKRPAWLPNESLAHYRSRMRRRVRNAACSYLAAALRNGGRRNMGRN